MLEDWTISFGPITIGDAETLPAVNFVEFDPLSMPEIRSNDVELIQRDGLWAGDDYLGGKTINLSLAVQAENCEEFEHAVNLIMTAFTPGIDGESPLRFKIPGLCSGQEAFVKVRTRRRSNPLDASFARLSCAFEIELFATDPVIYAAEETLVTLRHGIPGVVPVRGSRPVEPELLFTDVDSPEIYDANSGTLLESFSGSGSFEVPGQQLMPGRHFLMLQGGGEVRFKFRDTWV